MTDTFYPVSTNPGHGHTHSHAHASTHAHTHTHNPLPHALHTSSSTASSQRYTAPAVDPAQEDDGQISCICGYADDDGMTVACDRCNRWQHTLCYYPQYDGGDLPAELQHFCVECQPRFIDHDGARTRQRSRRGQPDASLNGARRPASKSHKKKVKEPLIQTNGWPMDKSRHDRNSASPRDQPPPAKRPKTSHRNSDSITGAATKVHARKRTATNALHRRSLSRSPDSPIDYYSTEFMRCYLDDQWAVTNANLHNDIRTTNKLSEWLRAPDDLFREQTGHEKTDVLMRWDGELDDIPGKAQIQVHDQHDETVKDDNGSFPMWKAVTVAEPVASGAYIGELRGHVGLKDDYKADPNNRWSLLRHPEPFVFSHPKLPIVIDARNEGTELRYVRRSCLPNATLRILVTDSTDYRFCFMASEQIDPGMEVAVAWDTQDSLPDDCRNPSNGIGNKEMDMLSNWVSNVLANCGPCACQLPPSECAMSRFDRRIAPAGFDEDVASSKMPKSKKKKLGHHISPLNTHALNSRSGSEARKAEPDDEPTDSRSASGSGGGGSVSRDITPNTHYSANGSLSAAPEISERERKKLAKEEEMFRRQEEEQSGKQGKKKRHSGGPNMSRTGQLSRTSTLSGPRYVNSSTSRQIDLPLARSVTGERTKPPLTEKPPMRIYKTVKRPTPNYVVTEVQCNMDNEEAERRKAAQPSSPSARKKYMSVTQRLLQRCAENNARLKASRDRGGNIALSLHQVHAVESTRPSIPSGQEIRDSGLTKREQSLPDGLAPPPSSHDADMDGAHSSDREESPKSHQAPMQESGEPGSAGSAALHPAIDPSAPPWTSSSSPEEVQGELTHRRPSNMHVQMPPPPSNPFGNGPPPLLPVGSSSSMTPSAFMHSPATLTPGAGAPMFSPSVTAAVQPSPARKKLSLSDYTKRNKTKDVRDSNDQSKLPYDRDSSPASVASVGPVVPPLQPSGSFMEAQAKTGGDGGGSAVVDDGDAQTEEVEGTGEGGGDDVIASKAT